MGNAIHGAGHHRRIVVDDVNRANGDDLVLEKIGADGKGSRGTNGKQELVYIDQYDDHH